MTKPAEVPVPIVRRGVVAVVLREKRYLVIRRAAGVPAPGQYCFPGGGIEGDETEDEALVREMHEELSVAVRPLKCVWRSVTSWGVSLAWWLSELDADASLVANLSEVESIHWLMPEEMLALGELLESNRQFLAGVSQGAIRLI